MTIKEKFEAADNEFLEFKRIPKEQRRHPCPDVCAFIYLHEIFGDKNKDEASSIVSAAEHDEIFLSPNTKKLNKLTQEDVVYLHRCGVRLGEYGLTMFT